MPERVYKTTESQRRYAKEWMIKNYGSVKNYFSYMAAKQSCEIMVAGAIESKEDPESLFKDPAFIQRLTGLSCKRLEKLAEAKK